jgi:drug/metabolite transporter (DMT)-like permease
MLAAKVGSRRVDYAVLVFYRLAIAAVVVAAWTLITGKADFRVAMPFWGATLVGALLGPCASFLFTFKSYRYWELSRAAIVRTAQPLFVLPMAYFAFGAIPRGRVLLGGFLILGGAFWLGWIHLSATRKLRERRR